MIRRTFILGVLAIAGCGDDAIGLTGHDNADRPDLGPAPEVAAPPDFDPPSGTFTKVPIVTIRTATPGATIHYTMNGTTPDSTSPIYTLPLAIARTTTLKAIARRPGSRDSEVRSATYDIDVPYGQASPVHFEPSTGRYSNDVHVTLSSASAGATLCYTVDDSQPTCGQGPVCTGGSLTYGAPVTIGRTEQRIRAIACKRGTGNSSATAAVYTFQVTKPTADPPVERYDPLHPVPITLASKTEGSQIHYTLDGTWPTCQSPNAVPSGSKLPLLTADTRVWAIACKDGYAASETFDAKYLGTTCVGDLRAMTPGDLESLSRCKEIQGSLSVSGDSITSMHPLDGLERVSGALWFSASSVEEWIAPSTLTQVRWLDISNASHLRHVGGFSGISDFGSGGVTVESNPELTTFDALQHVATISGTLRIERNDKLNRFELPNLKSTRELELYDLPALASLEGLRSLAHVEDLAFFGELGFANLKGLERITSLDVGLRVRNSTGLVSLAGLDNLTTVRTLDIYNSALTSLRGLDKVETIQALSVEQNGALNEIGGLNALTSGQAHLSFAGNPKLWHLNGLRSIRAVGELLLFGNDSLTKLDGFDRLDHVTRDVLIRLNALGSLDDLHALTKIDGDLIIDSERSLPGLSGLGALQSIGGALRITQNPALLRVDGLAGLTQLDGSLRVEKNLVLPPCQPEALVKRLVELGYTGSITLRDNGGTGGCP